jgi:hypothetical protein
LRDIGYFFDFVLPGRHDINDRSSLNAGCGLIRSSKSTPLSLPDIRPELRRTPLHKTAYARAAMIT